MNCSDEPVIDPAEISPADGQVLDAILGNGALGRLERRSEAQEGDAWSGQDRRRVEKVCQVVSLLDWYGTDVVPEDLVERTLARIHEARQRQRFAQQVQVLGDGSGSAYNRFQWGELLTVAAVILIGASLLWPVLDRVRGDARRVACSGNLAVAGQAIDRYAHDHDRLLPRGHVKPGAVWWNVGGASNADGQVHSNSAHLYILVRSRYIDAVTLACPDNPWTVNRMDHSMHDWPAAKAVSYSYQNQYTQSPLRLDELPEMAILADKNPLFVNRSDGVAGLAYRSDLDPTSPSDFHRRQGQNILTSSGQVLWRARPIGPNGDNIWLIRGVSSYRGVEAPRDVDDSFLVP